MQKSLKMSVIGMVVAAGLAFANTAQAHTVALNNAGISDQTAPPFSNPTQPQDNLVKVLAEVEHITGPWRTAAAGLPEPCELTLRVAKGSVPNNPDAESLVISFWQGDPLDSVLQTARKLQLVFAADGSLQSMGPVVGF